MTQLETIDKIIAEWVIRNYITEEQATNNKALYDSYIKQSVNEAFTYCGILPMTADVPDGMFYALVEFSWGTTQGITTTDVTVGEVKSVSEGDTSISYTTSADTKKKDNTPTKINYYTILNEFRRPKW